MNINSAALKTFIAQLAAKSPPGKALCASVQHGWRCKLDAGGTGPRSPRGRQRMPGQHGTLSMGKFFE